MGIGRKARSSDKEAGSSSNSDPVRVARRVVVCEVQRCEGCAGCVGCAGCEGCARCAGCAGCDGGANARARVAGTPAPSRSTQVRRSVYCRAMQTLLAEAIGTMILVLLGD